MLAQGLDPDKMKITMMEDEIKVLKKKVDTEEFKRKLLELKLDLLMQKLNDLEGRLSAEKK